jgi:hypothetical protein
LAALVQVDMDAVWRRKVNAEAINEGVDGWISRTERRVFEYRME